MRAFIRINETLFGGLVAASALIRAAVQAPIVYVGKRAEEAAAAIQLRGAEKRTSSQSLCVEQT